MNFLHALDKEFRGAAAGIAALLAFYYLIMKPLFGV